MVQHQPYAPTGTGLTNYNIYYVSGHLTVTKATPTFSDVSLPPITPGINTAMISGYIGASTTPATGSVVLTITINGIILFESVPLIHGDFSAAYKRNWAVGTYTVTYHYAGNAEFNAITPDGSSDLIVS